MNILARWLPTALLLLGWPWSALAQEEPPLTRAEPVVRMVLQEAANEPYVGMVAIAAVALDRVADQRWPGTAKAVIYQRAQFTSMTLQLRRYSRRQIRQARAAVVHARAGWRPCGAGVLWYYAAWSKAPAWASRLAFRCALGDHLFYAEG